MRPHKFGKNTCKEMVENGFTFFKIYSDLKKKHKKDKSAELVLFSDVRPLSSTEFIFQS